MCSSDLDQHMEELTQGNRRPLGRLDQDPNPSLLATAETLGIVIGCAITGVTTTPIAFGMGLYSNWPAINEVYRISVENHRLSILHPLNFFSITLWFSGSYWAALSSILVTTLGQKVYLLTRIVTRRSISQFVWLVASPSVGGGRWRTEAGSCSPPPLCSVAVCMCVWRRRV